jgi:hypothetical protein
VFFIVQTISMTYYLANVRGIAERILHEVQSFTGDATLTTVEQSFLDFAIVIVSLVVVVNTALQFMVVLRDLHEAARHRNARARFRAATSTLNQIEQQLEESREEFRKRSWQWDNRESRVAPILDALLAVEENEVLELASIPIPSPVVRSRKEIVNDILAPRGQAMTGGAGHYADIRN